MKFFFMMQSNVREAFLEQKDQAETNTHEPLRHSGWILFWHGHFSSRWVQFLGGRVDSLFFLRHREILPAAAAGPQRDVKPICEVNSFGAQSMKRLLSYSVSPLLFIFIPTATPQGLRQKWIFFMSGIKITSTHLSSLNTNTAKTHGEA